MTEENNPPKVKPSTYDLGKGDYLTTVPTANGYQCWGYVAGNRIEFQDKDLKAIEGKIVSFLTDANEDYLNKAIRFEEIALKIKESGLEKTAKESGEKK